MFKKIVTSSLSLLAVLGATRTAMAFEPIAEAEAPTLIGKTIYSADSGCIDRGCMFAGEPVVVVAVEKRSSDVGLMTVRTKEGAEFESDLESLSKSPLRYNLRAPGDPKAFLKSVMVEAFALEESTHDLYKRYNHDLPLGPERAKVRAMERHLSRDMSLLERFANGTSNKTRAELLADADTKWLAKGGVLLDWYAGGIPDRNDKSNVVAALKALEAAKEIVFHEQQLQRRTDTKTRLDRIPAKDRSLSQQEEIASLGAEIARLTQELAAERRQSAKLRAGVR